MRASAKEAGAQFKLAGPIFVNTIAMVLLVTVDMVMVGRLGAEALGAVALANGVSTLIVVLGTISLSPIGALISRASGAKDAAEVRSAFAHGLVAAVVLSVPMVLLLLASDWTIPTLTHLRPSVSI